MDDKITGVPDAPDDENNGDVFDNIDSTSEDGRPHEETETLRAYGVQAVSGKTETDEEPKVKTEEEKKQETRLDAYDWVQSIVSTLVVVILAFVFIGRQTGVSGYSMQNTLHNKDYVIITTLFYTPHYGDIVIINSDAFEDLLVKRVIATEGQTIDINPETHEVIVDGFVLNEPYIREPTRAMLNFNGLVTVPEGCVFVMGDNRNQSRDSRDSAVGFVDVREIIGKVRFIILPGIDRENNIPRDWSTLGSPYKTLP